ncbi:ABC transporter ATP-binding protein [Pedobacter alluvionis]|uniref:ABC transporter ATP-binding protein n=1 Tax=Pedobacter alluvionis TaxID=475253 RepID=A0A497YKN0_9SPHI|nr:ABC transporter ATP-binding protein [Pedobacter alluvionis]RLJ80620.1 ABC-2 type transport system ATP-binding protein [Pedobacter alluvionis]TFB31882.1 ABC transporter ATP-binding protein [Pedobacter alluvionis]
MEPIIDLKNLCKSYGSHVAVDQLNLKIPHGEIFGLLGPNGAGKTTSILMMLGLTEPDSGSAIVCGYDATRNPIEVKRKVGYMPDNLGFYPQLTGLENLVYMARLNGLPEKDIIENARRFMELVGLKAASDKPASSYSRGMKQRLGLAEVLIKKPELIILDEPTLGLDPNGVKEFLELIKSLQQEQGLTVLLSSHHLHHVQQVCDRVGIFVDGKLLATGDLPTLSHELFGNTGVETSIYLTQVPMDADVLKDKFSSFPELNSLTISGVNLQFNTTEDITPKLIRRLIESGLDIQAVSQKQYGLDEIYEKYFEKNTNLTPEHESD